MQHSVVVARQNSRQRWAEFVFRPVAHSNLPALIMSTRVSLPTRPTYRPVTLVTVQGVTTGRAMCWNRLKLSRLKVSFVLTRLKGTVRTVVWKTLEVHVFRINFRMRTVVSGLSMLSVLQFTCVTRVPSSTELMQHSSRTNSSLGIVWNKAAQLCTRVVTGPGVFSPR